MQQDNQHLLTYAALSPIEHLPGDSSVLVTVIGQGMGFLDDDLQFQFCCVFVLSDFSLGLSEPDLPLPLFNTLYP
jgi:hypothetical protein